MQRPTQIVQTADRSTWDGLLFVLAATVALFARFRTPTLLLASYQDDFFYYLKIAQNLADHGVSTFNGMTLSNGYHPLWMVVLTMLARLFHGTLFFIALQLLSLGAAVVFRTFTLRTLRLVTSDSVARAATLVLSLLAVLLIRYGMEVTLALPLGAALLYRLMRDGTPATLRGSATLGLIAAALILARLDAAILVGMLCCVMLWDAQRQPSRLPRMAAFLACCALPVAIYLVMNWHVFHLLTPVSGLAKQMRTSYLPTARTYHSLLPWDRQRILLILPQCVLLCVALFWPAGAGDRQRSQVLRAFVAFPFVHWLTIGMLSDWPTWPWYTYSLTLGSVGAFGLLYFHRPSPGFRLPLFAYAAVLCLYIAAYAVLGPDSVTLVASSRQVAQFMDAHPGTYLMGDQSGTTGYLSHQPIVQTEGLVMDRAFLQVMRARTPLRTVAARYHASYYVGVGQPEEGACFALHEPGNAGPTSPMMRGRICHEPLATYSRGGIPIRIFRTDWIDATSR